MSMLEFSGLNYWAVLVAWLISMAVGSFWYSPVGFGKLWGKLSGVDLMTLPKAEANRAIGFVAVSSLLQAVALAVLINSLGASSLVEGVKIGLFTWFGFTALTTVGTTLYARRNWKFWWLDASFFLLVMVVNGAILAVWN